MKNELLLLSGADIPFIEATAVIHQPTIYEISYIGEEGFFTGCEILRFSKDTLTDEDKTKLFDYTDFNILMSIMNDKSESLRKQVTYARQVLELILPWYNVEITQSAIELYERETSYKAGEINDANFLQFKDILTKMFCLEKASTSDGYNVQGDLAKKIANKFKKRQQKLAELKASQTKVAIFSKYISILTVGEYKDMNSFMKYTVYQLFDEFQRYQLKTGYDIFLKARLAGASDLKEPEDWMKDIHS